MELINRAISKLETAKRSRRFSHDHKNEAKTKFLSNIIKYIDEANTNENDKEVWLKAYEMQSNRAKAARNRRDINSDENALKEILNDFKKARDQLYEEYEWKRYNLSEVWSRWEEKSGNKITINPINCTNDAIPYPNEGSHDCTTHIGVTASIFGAIILLVALLLKLTKKSQF